MGERGRARAERCYSARRGCAPAVDTLMQVMTRADRGGADGASPAAGEAPAPRAIA